MNWKWTDATKTAVMRFEGPVQHLRTIRDAEVQEWLAEGNEPDPPDPPPDPSTKPPSIYERIEAAETLINLILDEEGE